ncbi:FecR family protein [Maribellus mangrovi]|uniref:FecR family protein n=1 Tax=Maribellus mangrovi TaxID=3133146 RepID=UPI0030EDDD44
MDRNDKIRKWLKGELTDSERKDFESSDEFAEMRRLMDAVNKFAAPPYNAEKEYRKFEGKHLKTNREISLYQRISPVLKVAAVLVFVVLLGYFVFDRGSNTGNGNGWIADQTEIFLPDSSFVLLNADSRIRYNKSGWENDRKVELQGDAFFTVKKGSQFKVKTGQGTVTVLGTEFEVEDRKKYYEVICYSGSVQVVTGQHSVVLEPQSAFRIIDNKEDNYTISSQSEPEWLSGESSFKSVPLQYVLKELERQYQVSVKAEGVDLNQLFTGSFSHENLNIALESITFPVNLDYQINGNKIVLSFEGK